MDKAQALCMLVCLAGAAAGYAGFYQSKAEDNEDASTLGFHHENVQQGDSASVEDVLGDHKDLLDPPKDLLGDDLEDFAKHGGDPPNDSLKASDSGEEAHDHQDVVVGYEEQDKEPQSQSHGDLAGLVQQDEVHAEENPPPTGQEHYEEVRAEPEQERHPDEYEDLRRPEYAYKYGVHDPDTKDVKSAWELRDGDHTRGGYSLVEPDGHTRIVEYSVSKTGGFNALVKRLPPT